MFIVYVTFTILSCSLLVAVSGRPCRLSVVVRVAVGGGRGVGVTRAAAAEGLKVDFVFTFAFRFYFVCVYFAVVFCKGARGGATLRALCLFNICSGCRHRQRRFVFPHTRFQVFSLHVCKSD